MAGSKASGKKAAETIRKRYGADYYAKVGAMGGRQTYESGKLFMNGFAGHRELARVVGARGGRVSRRRKSNESL
jgi:hypothetical protein